jgi:metallo-beta-lactamase family protein
MKIGFWGAAGTVTGSRFLLDGSKGRVLVDCGMFQGGRQIRKRNWEPFPADPASINAVVLTHAHIDHSGMLPAFVRDGFSGPIYCTPATAELLELLLRDSAHLQEEEARYANKKKSSRHVPAKPLFTIEDAEAALKLLEVRKFSTSFSPAPGFEASYSHAGHILGAASVRIVENDVSVLFSGDLGQEGDLVMREPDEPPASDYVLIESTYGDRLHADGDPFAEIEKVVNKTIANGGSVLFPAFAVGRSQVLMHILAELRHQERIPNVPIYLNSPMAASVTDLYLRFASEHNLSDEQCSRIWSGVEFVQTIEQSKELTASDEPKIVISASGMATGGRVLHHLIAMLPHSQNSVVFAGHQVEGTRGALLVNGLKKIRIYGDEIDVFANIVHMEELSAHADRDELISWLKKMPKKPKKVFVVHGEPDAAASLQQIIRDEMHWPVDIPQHGQEKDFFS